MVEFFIFLTFLLLSLLGISEAMCMFINWLLKPKVKAQKVLIVFLKEGFAEQQLLQVAESLNWRGTAMADKIVAYVGGIDSDEKEALLGRFSSNRNIVFSDAVNIKGI